MSLSHIAGRTVDVSVLQTPSLRGDTRLSMSLGPDVGGQEITGIQKVVQQFASLFLTERGSSFFDSSRGTDFTGLLTSGRLYSDAEVSMHFQMSASDIVDYMRKSATADTPADEQITEAVLSWFTLAPPSLVLGIKINTAAGTSRPIILPIG